MTWDCSHGDELIKRNRLQGSQVAPCDRDETLLAAVRLEDGTCVVITHIVIGAVVAGHGDAPAAKLQDEKGQGIEWHG